MGSCCSGSGRCRGGSVGSDSRRCSTSSNSRRTSDSGTRNSGSRSRNNTPGGLPGGGGLTGVPITGRPPPGTSVASRLDPAIASDYHNGGITAPNTATTKAYPSSSSHHRVDTMPYGASVVCTLHVHTSDVNGVAFSPSALASCGGDKVVRVWSLDDFSELGYSPLTGHRYSINGCTFSPDGSLLVSYSTDGRAVMWDVKTGEEVGVLAHPSQGSIRVCRFAPGGEVVVTGSDDETMCLWDVATRKLIRSYEGHEASLPAATFCPAGAFLVCGNVNGYLKVFDALGRTDRQLWYEMNAHDLGVTCCTFSPTYGAAGDKLSTDAPKVHYLLATCGYDNNIKLWDFVALIDNVSVMLTLRNTLSGHNDSVMDCNFSPDGQLLASAAGDKTVRLWDPIKGQHVYTILGHSRFVTCCCFSVDGRYLASGSNDRDVKVWRIARTDELTQESKQLKALRPLREATVSTAPPTHTAYYMKDLEDWGIDEVCQWLADLGMPQYVDQFRQHAIDGTELLTLSNDLLEKNFSIIVLGHRNKLARAIEDLREQPARQQHAAANGVPDEFLCPITREIMGDPVIASDGFTYERMAITDWMTRGKTYSPMTNGPLSNTTLTPNRSVKMLIQRHVQDAK